MIEKKIGEIAGKDIIEYTLTNASQMQVSVMNYGGTITKIITADKTGNFGDVVLGFNSAEGYYQTKDKYIGCLVGRYANRIGNAQFTLDGKDYFLAANNNGQSLHGGDTGFDKVIWTVEKDKTKEAIHLTYFSTDGEEGFPGNLSVKVTYTLTDDNTLQIDYLAEADKATPASLTSHSYFNLSGGADATIHDHDLKINATHFTPVNKFSIPTGEIKNVENTAMDFTNFKNIGAGLESIKDGYDHNWALIKNDETLTLAASLRHPASGRQMEVYTTKPGLQFYTGNFLDGNLKNTKPNNNMQKHGGLCLETQFFPDGPNQPEFPNTILKPGERYEHTTKYRFSILP